ncbi:hypothetical protein VPH35_000673 [Triticum aestivum]
MPRKSWKPRGGPGCVAPAPELHWKALNPNPIPAEVPECSRSRAAEVSDDDAFVGVPVATAEDALVEEEIAGKLAGIDMELSQEEFRANHQMQEDEVHVHIEIPDDGIDVSAKLDYGTETLNYGETCNGDALDNLVYKFRVEHLPPILLTCYLPSSYPSHQPPSFTISTEWLDTVKISSLCQMLEMIWEEQQGMEVIYQWVQWLQNSLLSHLGFTDEIILSKGDLTCHEDGGDKRACRDDSAPDVIITRIMRYDDDKRHEAFLHDIHGCMICFSEFPGKQERGDQNLTDEVLSLQAIMRDAKQCPGCKIAIYKISGCNKMTCSNCGHYFCYQCNFAIVGYEHFRPGACDLFSREEIRKWEARMNPGTGHVEDAPAPAPLPEGRYRHPCPTCGKGTPKIGNNNHISCGSCQTGFCALCRKTVHKTSQHFGPRGCKQHTADHD